ncbi:MAG: phospholipid carrier-dependent glycosyltransferase [Pyrinomonadaceae bacterium]|nr:phospholipid carrier-dependent glycosyltransferase [Pyrinomonadaceae bacterium]
MDKVLIVLCFAFGLVMSAVGFPEGAVAALLTAFFGTIAVYLIRTFFKEDAELLTRIFLIALLVRLLFGIIIQVYNLREFFGGDANTYDRLGFQLVEGWFGQALNDPKSQNLTSMTSGWGMNYLTGFIYIFTGRNVFAAQSFCAVIGAAIAPMIYKCSFEIFSNRRVSKISALFVALYPAFIVWSGQLLKDGIIIFLLVLAITMVLQLQRKFSYVNTALLVLSLFGILSLRFYIFYMVAVAVVGAFIVGFSNSSASIFRRVFVLVIMGLGLTYLGVLREAGGDLDQYANLERIQESRKDLAASADSGFGEDLDVSTMEGAITILPLGFLYLMLAPFPWQISSFRQAITLPEIMLWWASIPFLLSGLWYTIKYKLRTSLAILIFTLMLTLAYSVFQGNVGTAYRQRTQIQVFLFIFIAVGWTLRQEHNEDLIALRKARRKIA